MPSLALSTAMALFAAYGVSAQDVKATIWAYSTQECAGDAFGESTSMEIFDSNTVLSGGTWNCMYSQTSLPGFEMVNGQYKIFVDESTIPDDCSLVLYQGAPKGDDVNQGECQTYYSSISNKNGACVETEIAPQYGYAMCCGTNCDSAPQPPPGKRMFEKAKPRDVSTPGKRSAEKAKVRDVTAHKRTAPLNNLNPRADCSFSGSGNSLTTFGIQEKVVSTLDCTASTESCTISDTFDYTSSDTNTFGVSTEIGAAFEIFSASVSFSAEVSHTESKSYTKAYSVTIPPGQSGYLTFQAKYECTPKGTLSGSDCLGLPTDKEGTACYPVFIGGAPDGNYLFVQDI